MLEREYYHLENMTNFDQLPPHGFKLSRVPDQVGEHDGRPGPRRGDHRGLRWRDALPLRPAGNPGHGACDTERVGNRRATARRWDRRPGASQIGPYPSRGGRRRQAHRRPRLRHYPGRTGASDRRALHHGGSAGEPAGARVVSGADRSCARWSDRSRFATVRRSPATSATRLPPRIPLLRCLCTVPSSTRFGVGGERHLPISEFFTGPGRTALGPAELVTSIDLPLPTAPLGAAFMRLTRRRGVDLATSPCVAPSRAPATSASALGRGRADAAAGDRHQPRGRTAARRLSPASPRRRARSPTYARPATTAPRCCRSSSGGRCRSRCSASTERDRGTVRSRIGGW